MARSSTLLKLTPEQAADAIASGADSAWANRLLEELEQRLRIEPLERMCAVWGLSNAGAARLFGVSRQAFAKWLTHGPPAERAPVVADLDAATEILVARVKRDRIPAVVRRPAARLDGKSLLDLASDGRAADVRDQVREWFDLRRVQP